MEKQQGSPSKILKIKLPYDSLILLMSIRLKELKGFPGGSVAKNAPSNAGDVGDVGSIPVSGRSPGLQNGNLL